MVSIKNWISNIDAEEAGNESLGAAREIAAKHWEQILLAGARQFEIAAAAGKTGTSAIFCGLCARFKHYCLKYDDGVLRACPLRAHADQRNNCIQLYHDVINNIHRDVHNGLDTRWSEDTIVLIKNLINAIKNNESKIMTKYNKGRQCDVYA